MSKMTEMEKIKADSFKVYLPPKRMARIAGVDDDLIRDIVEAGKVSYIPIGKKKRLINRVECLNCLKSMEVRSIE